MRLSHLFFATLRDDPVDAEMPSHRLLLRAGYLRQLGSGIYSLLPLGKRVSDRVEQVIREEQNAIGGQEMEMPVVHPADIWRASGRYDAIGPELTRFKDRGGRDMVLAMTHEEVVGILLADIVRSYRQLPMMVYHFQTKWRDEPRSRGGLIRVREFVMKDAYSCDLDDAGLDASYQAQYGAYERTFERLGLEVVAVSSDVGIMGGTGAHEFMVLNPAGEDVLVLCESCGYAANRQVAVVPKPEGSGEAPLPREDVATPGTTTIATLAAFLGIDASRTAKAAFFMTGDGRLVTAIVRGDFEVNETKLGNAASAVGGIRPATVEEIRAAGMEPGYGSPIGAHDTTVVIDDLVARSPNLVAGANREGFHVRNVNVGRDFSPDVTADITNAQEGDPCPDCGTGVILRNGIEVGNIFKLGTKFTDAFGATYLGEDGVAHPIVMGSYGIGVGSQRRLRRRGPSRREGHRLAGRGRALRRPPRDDRGRKGAAGHRGRPTAARPRGGRRHAPRTALGRPRRVAGRQVHRRRAAGHALDRDDQPAIAGRGRHRGHGAGDRGALDATDRGRGGVADRSALGAGELLGEFPGERGAGGVDLGVVKGGPVERDDRFAAFGQGVHERGGRDALAGDRSR